MNKKRIFAILLGAMVLIGLAACTQKSGNPQTTVEPPSAAVSTPDVTQTAAPSDGSQLSATPTIDGDALIREKLQNHHSIDRIYGATKTREEWNTTLDRMIGYGAKISEEEKQIIIDYLLSRNP
jgi:hypothetical protein